MISYYLLLPGTPKNLSIQIFNEDVGVIIPVLSLNLSISEAYISVLDTDVMNISRSRSLDDAKSLVESGKSWGVIAFHSNFSEDTVARYDIV